MDLVGTWSEKLAQEAIPDEVDLAPFIAEAYAKGGKDRKQLFHSAKDGQLGAFSPGDALIIFPFLLQAIATAAPILYRVLSSGAINNLLSLIKDALSLKEHVHREKKLEQATGNEYDQMRQVINMISSALPSSLRKDQRDLITYRVLQALLADPQGARPFLQKITEKK